MGVFIQNKLQIQNTKNMFHFLCFDILFPSSFFSSHYHRPSLYSFHLFKPNLPSPLTIAAFSSSLQAITTSHRFLLFLSSSQICHLLLYSLHLFKAIIIAAQIHRHRFLPFLSSHRRRPRWKQITAANEE